ncbi:MAG: hypothetical protein NC200_03175, partial [Candidatus Gastranaerophilales bacterium]|nr:hypothetical protein [Candidatus Gastranaerophilales bacterium]
ELIAAEINITISNVIVGFTPLTVDTKKYIEMPKTNNINNVSSNIFLFAYENASIKYFTKHLSDLNQSKKSLQN